MIILAAGGSRRLGTPKQLVQFKGETLLRRIVREAMSSGCSPVVVVLGSEADRSRDEISGSDVLIAANPLWERGMGGSIKRGLNALKASGSPVDAAVICACDQPFVTADIIAQLASRFYQTGKAVIASGYEQTIGVPALFSKDMFPILLELDDASGAKAMINRQDAEIIPFPAGAFDIDTMADVQRLDTI